jgi:arylsulfatase A
MRRLALLICVLLSLPLHAADAPPRRRPNVILIITDDQGSIDAGCYGSADLKTPNIDALASRGVRFTQFYAAAPVCSPSRAGLLTGRYPLRAGIVNNAASQKDAPGGMDPQVPTMAEIFRSAGYATGHFGKWHLGYTDATRPNARGFDTSFGHMGGCIDNYSHFFYWSGPNVHDLHLNGHEIHRPGEFFPDLLVKEAGAFIESNKTRPFFMYFAINLPHYPYQPDVKWLEHYEDLPHPRRPYAAFLSTMDERLGALLKRVDDLGLRDDTIVVFQSDNGHSTEERAHFAGGNAGPYRGAKFSLFEGGIRVPAIVAWPGRVPQGQVRGQVAHGCDWLPTLAEWCDVKLPADAAAIDGRSLAKVVASRDAPTPHDVLHWHMGQQWAVREGPWKLIGNANDTTNAESAKVKIPTFLSNVDADPGERSDQSSANPDVVRRLRQLHDEWLAAGPRPAARP